MLPKKVILLLLVAELIIPVLGYFLWNWDYSFILLFYALDWIAFLVFQGVKMRKRLQFTAIVSEKQQAFKTAGIYLLVFIASLTVIYLSILSIDPNFDVIVQLKQFFLYKDMGIEQGYLLVPLTLLGAQRNYRTQFLNLKIYERFTIRQIFKSSIQQHLVLFIGIILISGSVAVFKLSPNVLLFSCVIGVFLGKLYFQVLKNNI